MKFLLPLLMLASVGAPPAPDSTRDDDRGPPDPPPPEPTPSRPTPPPEPHTEPVSPLANVPDATLRRRARKGVREAVTEMARRGRLDGCGLYRGTITEDAARRAGYRGCGGAKVFFLTYRQERPVPGVPIVANWVWARIGDRLDQLIAGCLTVVPDGGAP